VEPVRPDHVRADHVGGDPDALGDTPAEHSGATPPLPPDFADPAATADAADPATLDELDPSPWTESDVTPTEEPGRWQNEPVTAPPPWLVVEPDADGERFPTEPASGLFGAIPDWGQSRPVDEPTTEPSAAATEGTGTEGTWTEDERPEDADHVEAEEGLSPTPFHAHTSALFAVSDPEEEERAAAFFADEEPLEEIAAMAQEPDPVDIPSGMTPAAFSNRLIRWPEPFKSVTYLGENPTHPRRRKGVTLVFSPAGVTAVASGFSSWKVHLGWDEVRDLEFQGADEVKFTYDHRIDSNGTAAIVHLTDGSVMVFDVKGRRPAMMRSTMAPIVNAVATHRSSISGNDTFSF
jgi:hypothetical protein